MVAYVIILRYVKYSHYFPEDHLSSIFWLSCVCGFYDVSSGNASRVNGFYIKDNVPDAQLFVPLKRSCTTVTLL